MELLLHRLLLELLVMLELLLFSNMLLGVRDFDAPRDIPLLLLLFSVKLLFSLLLLVLRNE